MPLSYDAMYRALVTSTTDLTNSGKIRVQCPQISGTAEIRSAEPVNPDDRIPTVGSTVWLAFNGGDLTKPLYFSNDSFTEAHPNGSVSLTSLTTPSTPDAARILALPGQDGQTTGSTTAPIVLFIDEDATSDEDIGVSGSVIKTDVFGDPEVWHTPTFSSGWAGTGTFNGTNTFHSIQYKIDAEDNVWVYGCATTTTAATGTIFVLPTAYRPPTRAFLPAQLSPGGGNGVTMMVQVTEGGSINYSSLVSGHSVAVNDTVFVNGKFPRGNLA